MQVFNYVVPPSNKEIQDHFGYLISNGWGRDEAIKSIVESSGIDYVLIEAMVQHRG